MDKWISPPSVATPTIRNPQPPVDNSGGAVDCLYAQPLIHRLSTPNPQGYPQGYPHDPAHRVGPESHPTVNHQTPPPTRHPHPETQHHPETQPQNPDPTTPATTPPPTTHQVPCTHAMDHIQPTPTLANKLEQTQETSPRKSKLQMRRPRPSHHPTTHQERGTGTAAPVAPPRMHHARNRRRPHHRRRQPRTKQSPSPVARLPHSQDHTRERRSQGTHTRHGHTRTAATPMRARNTNKRKRKTKQNKTKNKRKRNPKRNDATRNLELRKSKPQKSKPAPWYSLPSPHTRKTGGDSNHRAGCSERQRLG